ncbi:MAG: tetratricopeptide repeat protein [Planctomycetales bacterium]|nr:tetratricopeptide repeat protein [Planctomycetales bacterium]
MSVLNSFRWPLVAALMALFTVSIVHGQENFFGDSTDDDAAFESDSTDSFGSDSSGGFGSDSTDSTTEEDPAVVIEQINTALDDIKATRKAEDYEGAMEKIRALMEQHPTNGYAQYSCGLEMGRCHLGMGNESLAMRLFSDLLVAPGIMSVPNIYSGAYVEIGKAKVEGGNYLEAVDDFTEAVQVDPNNAEAHHYLGKANFLQVITSPGGGMDATSFAGFRAAMSSISKAIEVDPEYGEAYLDRGRVLIRMRNPKFAVQDHEKAVQFLGQDSDAMGDLAFTYRSSAKAEANKKDFDQAKVISDYRKSIQSMDTYLKHHNVNEEQKPWDDSSPLDIPPHSVLIARAEAKVDLGDEQSSNAMYEDAIKDCDSFLRIAHIGPAEKSQGYYVRGLALRMLNRLDEAVDDLTKSIDNAKQTQQATYAGQAYLRRGIILFRQGKYHEAIKDFDDATFANSPIQADPRAMLWLGFCHARLGDLDSASRAYTSAIRVYSDFVPAYMNRGLLRMKTGRFADAYDDFNSVIRLDPGNKSAAKYRDAAKKYADQINDSVTASF